MTAKKSRCIILIRRWSYLTSGIIYYYAYNSQPSRAYPHPDLFEQWFRRFQKSAMKPAVTVSRRTHLSFYLIFVIRKPPTPVPDRRVTWIADRICFRDHAIDNIFDNFRCILLMDHHLIRQLPVQSTTAFIRTFQPVDHVPFSFPADLLLTSQHLIPIFQPAAALITDTNFIALYKKLPIPRWISSRILIH